MRSLFDFLYFFLSILLYLIALPLILYLSFKPKYRHSLPARFFLQKNGPFRQKGIWFHACSLGEVKALSPFIEKIRVSPVNISVITHTGFSAAKAYTQAQVRYLPYELFLPWWQKRQGLLIVLEAELWYALFLIAKARGTKTVLLNARISERSFPKYYKMRWFYRRLFEKVDIMFVQSETDKARFEALGAKCTLKVIGNIKLAQKIQTSRSYDKPEGITVIAGSTHEGEEALIMDAFKAFKQLHAEVRRLIVVPRHPERFEKVHALMQEMAQKQQWSYSRFSKDERLEADLILVDRMGELNNLYAVSDIAVLGGGFNPVGGHNPLEPIHFGCKLISGKHIFNQKELFSYVKHAQVIDNDGLVDALNRSLQMPVSHIDETVNLDEVYALIGEYDKRDARKEDKEIR